MPELETLGIGFNSPLPNRDVVRQLSNTQVITHVTLANLRMFTFGGVSAYLDGLLARISAPVLGVLRVRLLNQLTFTVPRLLQFMQTPENLVFKSVQLVFERDFVYLMAGPHWDLSTLTLWLQINCRHLDWQVSSAVQILGALSPVLSVVEQLTLRHGEHFPSSEWHNNVDRTQWRELLRPFSGVKTIRVESALVRELSRSLLSENGETLLPKLKEFRYSGGRSVRDASARFIKERKAVGHPVRLVSRL
jgi:hypothetical protein